MLLATLTPEDTNAEASTRSPNSRMACPPSASWHLKETEKQFLILMAGPQLEIHKLTTVLIRAQIELF
jgi:hypothetical protein